jgi:hypothetical protein
MLSGAEEDARWDVAGAGAAPPGFSTGGPWTVHAGYCFNLTGVRFVLAASSGRAVIRVQHASVGNPKRKV